MRIRKTLTIVFLAIFIFSCQEYVMAEKRSIQETTIKYKFATPKPAKKTSKPVKATVKPVKATVKPIVEKAKPTATERKRQYISGTEVKIPKDIDSIYYTIYGFLGFLIVVWVICYLSKRIKKNKEKTVESVSHKYSQITEINENYSFYLNIPDKYHIRYIAKSKKEFSEGKAENTIIYALTKEQDLQRIYEKLKYNRNNNNKYSKELSSIPETEPELIKQTHIKPRKFREYENSVCSKIIQHPPLDIRIIITLGWTDRKGKEYTVKPQEINYDMLEYAFDKTRQEEYRRYQARIERSKMSTTLRMQVLRRDGFRCTICGASANDDKNIHLQVDHIQPVSKGGKTELNNLRTLCSRCNRGKSDYYNPGGLN